MRSKIFFVSAACFAAHDIGYAESRDARSCAKPKNAMGDYRSSGRVPLRASHELDDDTFSH
jgi:hypothetical protein